MLESGSIEVQGFRVQRFRVNLGTGGAV